MGAPPSTAADALVWIQEALGAGRYNYDPHIIARLYDRGMNGNFQHVKRVIRSAAKCEPYVPEDGPKAGGTSWRITGTNLDGEETSVGAEAYYDTGNRRALFITIF